MIDLDSLSDGEVMARLVNRGWRERPAAEVLRLARGDEEPERTEALAWLDEELT